MPDPTADARPVPMSVWTTAWTGLVLLLMGCGSPTGDRAASSPPSPASSPPPLATPTAGAPRSCDDAQEDVVAEICADAAAFSGVEVADIEIQRVLTEAPDFDCPPEPDGLCEPGPLLADEPVLHLTLVAGGTELLYVAQGGGWARTTP